MVDSIPSKLRLWRLWPLAQWLSYYADILDAGLTKCVYHSRPAPKWNRLVAANVNRLALHVMRLGEHLFADLMNVYGLVVQIDALPPVDCDYHANFRQFFHGLRLWNVHF